MHHANAAMFCDSPVVQFLHMLKSNPYPLAEHGSDDPFATILSVRVRRTTCWRLMKPRVSTPMITWEPSLVSGGPSVSLKMRTGDSCFSSQAESLRNRLLVPWSNWCGLPVPQVAGWLRRSVPLSTSLLHEESVCDFVMTFFIFFLPSVLWQRLVETPSAHLTCVARAHVRFEVLVDCSSTSNPFW